MIEKIEKFILNGCYGDSIYYKKWTRNNKDSIEIDGQYSYMVELMIITLKSIIPSLEEVGNIIDYKRFSEELKLWKYYRHGGNSSLLNTFENFNDNDYWTKVDKSVYSRIVPIVISNGNFNIIRREIIKNVLYTTGNIKTLLECISLGKILHILINEPYDYAYIVEELKREMIHLSQVDYLNQYKEYYKTDVSTYPKNFTLQFERNKIDMINLLNGIDIKLYRLLSLTLDILENNTCDLNDIEANFFLYGLFALISKENYKKEFKDKAFIKSLCSYMVKLRKSRINPEGLIIEKYDSPDIFSYDENETFKHPLLNNCNVINKIENNNFIKSYIKTKSGIYRFIKVKN